MTAQELFEKSKISKSAFGQKLDDERIILDGQKEEYFSLNEIGSLIFESIEQGQSYVDCLENLLLIYEVDRETIEKDIIVFLNHLLENGLISLE